MTIASEAGHWYAKDGKPAYETIGKDGKPRKTTLRDARKHGYVPGVSDIIKCGAAEALNVWKIKQHLLTSAAAPRAQDEDEESYVARILKATKERLDKVPDLGTAIHGCIEKHLCDKQFDLEFKPHVDGALDALAKWCGGLDGIEPEKSFYHPLGFGGKCDIHKKPQWVTDFKTKEFGPAYLPITYENHAMQLAAYRHGFNMPKARCAIIYVSTMIPGLTHLVEVSEDELERGWRMFRSLLSYWQERNRYKPEGARDGLFAQA